MKLTRRGEIVFKVLLIAGAGLLFWGIWEVIGNLWWTGTGYCWGDMYECTKGGLL
jgi:hypothetical protein